jgi:hypothetical protein
VQSERSRHILQKAKARASIACVSSEITHAVLGPVSNQLFAAKSAKPGSASPGALLENSHIPSPGLSPTNSVPDLGPLVYRCGL